MVAKEISETRDPSTAGKPYIKSRTLDLPILILSVLLTGLIIFGKCCRDLSSQTQSEIIDVKYKLGELAKELQQLRYNYEYQCSMLQDKFGNCSYGQLSESLNDELDKLNEARSQHAKHLADVSKYLTESAAQLTILADVLTDIGYGTLCEVRGSGHVLEIRKVQCQQTGHQAVETRGHIEKLLQQVVSSLADVETSLKKVTENLILVEENIEQQEKEHRHTIAEIRTDAPNANTCEINGILKGEMKILEDFTNRLKEVNSKHQSDIEVINHRLFRLEWLLVLVCPTCLLCFMYIVFICTNGSGRPQRAFSDGPTGLPLHMVTVVTFTRETFERTQTVLPELLGQAAPTPKEVNYKLLTGELDLTQIPSSCGYIVVIGYDARNSIIEDMDGSMGSRKRLTIVGLQNTKHDVLVIYIENDPQRREPPVGSLYNIHLGRPTSHPILHQLVDNQRFLSLPNWKYTQHQAEHIRKWVRSL